MFEDHKSCPQCKTNCDPEDSFCSSCGFRFREVKSGDQFYDGWYLLEDLIGEGGMGSVWKAQKIINREDNITIDAAVKFLHRHYSEGRPDVVQMFKDEARILAELKNPHIVQLYDYGTDPGTRLFFIGMDRVNGDTLEVDIKKKRIYVNEVKSRKPQWERTEKKDPLPLLRVIDILEQVLDGINSAHERQIYHRDLKPSNLILEQLGEKDQVYVVDFGIARFREAEEKGEGRTSMQTIMGTYPYMSPEHFNGQAYGPESDIFALGIIMYEMLTGKKPFGGDEGERPTTIMNKIENYDHPNPAKYMAPPTKGFARPIRKIVNKALAKKPEDRYRSCIEFHADLEKLRQEEESTIPWGVLIALGTIIGLAIGFVVVAMLSQG